MNLLAIAALALTVAACHSETGAEASARIKAACERVYIAGPDVTDCELREEIRAAGDIQQSRADEAHSLAR